MATLIPVIAFVAGFAASAAANAAANAAAAAAASEIPRIALALTAEDAVNLVLTVIAVKVVLMVLALL